MSLVALPKPKPSYEDLEAENAKMRDVLTAYHFAQAFYRFHQFDGVEGDHCPACGSPVRIEESDTFEIRDGHRMPPGAKLVSVPWS